MSDFEQGQSCQGQGLSLSSFYAQAGAHESVSLIPGTGIHVAQSKAYRTTKVECKIQFCLIVIFFIFFLLSFVKFNILTVNFFTVFIFSQYGQTNMSEASEKTIERLLLYRRLLRNLNAGEMDHLYSHQLSGLLGVPSAQIRRDLMVIGYSGSPSKGYHVLELIKSIGAFVDPPEKIGVGLFGLGHLGRAILAYFKGRVPQLEIRAAFDINPEKTNRIYHGCRCYPSHMMESIIKENNIAIGILSVPADAAKEMAQQMVDAGIRGILNYAPVNLSLGPEIHVENRDMIIAVEKVAHFMYKQ